MLNGIKIMFVAFFFFFSCSEKHKINTDIKSIEQAEYLHLEEDGGYTVVCQNGFIETVSVDGVSNNDICPSSLGNARESEFTQITTVSADQFEAICKNGSSLLLTFEQVIGGSNCEASPKIVYLGSTDGNLYAINTSSGEQVWKYQTDRVAYGVTSVPLVSNGVVYFGSDDGYLRAVNATSGELIWRYKARSWIRSEPVIHNGLIYISSLDFSLYAIDAGTGRKIWEYKTDRGVYSSPIISEGIVYVGSKDSSLYAVDALTGELEWRFKTGGQVNANPVVKNGIVYVGSVDGRFYALNAKTGGLLWRTSPENEIFSNALFDNELLYFINSGSRLQVVEAQSGDNILNLDVGRTFSSPIKNKNVLYVPEKFNSLISFDLETLRVNWRFEIAEEIESIPVIDGDSLYLGANDTYFYSLDLHSGRVKWKFKTNGKIFRKAALSKP